MLLRDRSPNETPTSEVLAFEDIVDVNTMKDIQISPDGRQYVYALGKSCKNGADGFLSSIWIGETLGGASRQLTSGDYHDWEPRWSPDGRHLLFLSDRQDRGKTANIYLLSLSGGEPMALTKLKRGVGCPRWSPNGKFIAFLSADEPSEEDKKREEDKDDAQVYGENLVLARLRVVNVGSKAITTVVARDFDICELVWYPTGEEILFSTRKEPSINSMDAGMTIRKVSSCGAGLKDVVAWKSGIRSIGFIGSSVAFLAAVVHATSSSTALWKIVDGEAQRVVAGDTSCVSACAFNIGRSGIAAVRISEDLANRLVFYLESEQHVETVDEDGNDILLEGAIDAYDVHVDDETTVVFSHNGPNRAPEVWMGKGTGKTIRVCQISHHNEHFLRYKYGKVEEMRWTSTDKLDVQGVVVYPTSGNAPYPTILLIHGGPYGRTAFEFHVTWSRWAQMLAQRGYLILMPNYRGSSGRGEPFASLVRGHVGEGDWEDCNSMVDVAIERGLADPSRLGLGGWSQGGFLTAWAVSQTTRFKAAVMGAGVSDWSMMTSTSDMESFELECTGSAPWDGLEKRTDIKHSPLSYMTHPTTPTLILHGREDERVPYSQATAFHRALIARNVPVKLVAYPREPHGVQERNHQLDILSRVVNWFELYV
ncbi:hypothetical protein BZG36_05652 [Bifiguratus adelaidae]|uniref:Dipeptidyl-peptidase V n=1 Tax=Bifiguratus adelaidae TaxID=1938954 RepID=A0A261XT40_9FUNG|nr:hypothetical protein BZG36_05652 [Bifiguratus adelaidae]